MDYVMDVTVAEYQDPVVIFSLVIHNMFSVVHNNDGVIRHIFVGYISAIISCNSCHF